MRYGLVEEEAAEDEEERFAKVPSSPPLYLLSLVSRFVDELGKNDTAHPRLIMPPSCSASKRASVEDQALGG